MTPEFFRRLGIGPAAPVVVERAGGGLSRPVPTPGALVPIRRLTREATRILRCDRAGVWRIEPDGTSPICLTRYLAGEGRHEEGTEYPDTFGRHAALLLDRLTFLSMEGNQDSPPAAPPLAGYLEEEEVRAILAVPIRPRGILRGFFAFESTTGPRDWEMDDRNRAVTFAHQVARIWDEDHPESRSRSDGAGAGSPAAAPPPGAAPDDIAGPPPPTQEASDPDPPAEEASPIRPSEHVVETGASGRRVEMRVRRLREMEGAGHFGIEMASELEGLLSVQNGYLALLDDSDGEEDGTSALDEARALATRIRERLLEFLEWSEDRTHGRVEVELNTLLGELAPRLGRIAGDRVRLLLGPSAAPVRFRVHRALLERAIEQLVRNAREASDEGARVRVGIQPGDPGRESRAIRIVVEDRGHGISAEDLPWIFEPFFSTWRDRGGRGSGLPFVQAVVEGHGGWVDVVSTPGEGSRFILNLPGGDDLEAQRPESSTPAHGTEGRPVVLVIEDDTDRSRLLARLLERGGFHVLRSESGIEVDRLLKRRGEELALLVVGSRLEGGRSGFEVVERGRLFVPELPVLLVEGGHRTGAPGGDLVPHLRAREGIPADLPLLVPPFDLETLLRSVRAAIGGEPESPIRGEGTSTAEETPVH